MARRSGIQGVNHLRRTLNRIDPLITAELKTIFAEGAQAIEADALARVPKDSGDLALSIEVAFGRDALTAIIGPAAKAAAKAGGRTDPNAPFRRKRKKKLSFKTKKQLFEFFKGYWIEYGTKGNPKHNIPPMAPRPFMGPAYEANNEWILERVKKALDKVLERASQG